MTMMLLAGNLLVAIGLLSVFAMIRFRNVLKDTRDTTFTYVSRAPIDKIERYKAKKGWDACTGLGTPNGTAILAALRAAEK